jgi:Ras-related protein Rab-18
VTLESNQFAFDQKMSAHPPNTELAFKILLIGDSGTGKSSLLLRFTDDTFLEEEMSATIGVDFKVHFLSLPKSHATILNSDRMKLSIWDTAGQERFRTLTSSYYRGAQGVILVYDVTQRETFDHLIDTWLPELETYTLGNSSGVVKMVVGNKVDKANRQVELSEGARTLS